MALSEGVQGIPKATERSRTRPLRSIYARSASPRQEAEQEDTRTPVIGFTIFAFCAGDERFCCVGDGGSALQKP